MRAPIQEATGTAGSTEVIANFQRIGWAPVANRDHDLGTDLLVAVRDDRRFDRGLVIGVQVKAGLSWFKEPQLDPNGVVQGWWFYESSVEHFDDWVTHSLPHVLVLHDLDSRDSYWAQVTASACATTPKGCKLLVPANQKIDAASRDALLEIAGSQKATISLQGTAFSASASGIPPARRLRYALLAPRLVAPHPNSGKSKELLPEEGIALVAQLRLRELSDYAEKHPSIPDLKSSRAIRDWRWKFARALLLHLTQGDSSLIEEMRLSELPPQAKAALEAIAACGLFAREQHKTAHSQLTKAIEADIHSPVDLAWLLIHRARARIELGDASGARIDAISARKSLLGDVDDVTASVLAGTAAWILFSTADLGSHDLDQLVTANDTAVSWWRNQTASQALDNFAISNFRAWAEDTTMRWSAEDRLLADLESVKFSAALAGDTGAWRSATSRSARLSITGIHKANDVNSLASHLDDLRRTGDHESLKLSLKRIWNTGPILSVTTAANLVDRANFFHTSAYATFVMWSTAGDLVQEETATHSAHRCLDLLLDRASMDRFKRNVRPTFVVEPLAIDALAGLLPAAKKSAHDSAMKYLSALDGSDSFLSNTLSRLASHIEPTPSADLIESVRNSARRQKNRTLSASLYGLLARVGDEESSTTLIDIASRGDIDALSELDDVRKLDQTGVRRLISVLSGRVQKCVEDAGHGSFSMTVYDYGHALTILNLNHPDLADWDVIVRLLGRPEVAGSHKEMTCRALVSFSNGINPSVKKSILGTVEAIANSRSLPLGGETSLVGVSRSLLVSLEGVTSAKAEEIVAQLLSGTEDLRREGAILLGTGNAQSLEPALLCLLADPTSSVRCAAAAAVGALLRKGRSSSVIGTALSRIVQDSSARMPSACLAAMRGGSVPQWAFDLVIDLLGSPSARVRTLTSELTGARK